MPWSKARFNTVVLFVLFAVMFAACAEVQQSTERQVVSEYMLTEAGFGKLDVNDTTPNRQALLDAVPRGQFLNYRLDGVDYYVYANRISHALYIGDEAAYRKYQAMTNDRRLCQRLDAAEGAPFWSCLQDMQTGKK